MNRQAVAQELVKVAKLLTALDFPKPNNVNAAAWEKWVAEDAPKVDSLLRKYGVKVVKINPADAFYGYLSVEKDGRKFQIGLTDIAHEGKIKEIEAFLKKFKDAIATFDELMTIKDPFHSDVFRRVKSGFPGVGRDKAYQVIIGWLKDAGTRVWGD
jgi:hypothetical protein